MTRRPYSWMGLSILIGLLITACSSSDNTALVSPTPVINAQARQLLSFEVNPQPGFVDDVEASADWVITDHSCAPKHPISGVPIENTAHLAARVERSGASYVVSTLTDQVEGDRCHWSLALVDVRFFNGGRLVGGAGITPDAVQQLPVKPVTIVCQPSSLAPVDCMSLEAARNTFFKHPDVNRFQITIKDSQHYHL
ncbi:hypothetical protein [Luteibacter aegosomatissinici]|uniref:hypothetical protein n=1 Tax=Luteibacter aegosomatissinici TaxID=2911539 RepID=UPI001FFAD8E7|nr:hypothetical protein [Luteibacter aegosomatissinici]UPG96591.1 hypothetical protein L2Y97_10875 [Luteibacter aegosomatissinici]